MNLITRLTVHNYRSFRELTVDPNPISVVVGPNGAGKSNLADCIDFVSDVYRHGLDLAVARKGGVENIAHRKLRRVRSALYFNIVGHISATVPDFRNMLNEPLSGTFRIRHGFAFKGTSEAVRTQHEVVREEIELRHVDAEGSP